MLDPVEQDFFTPKLKLTLQGLGFPETAEDGGDALRFQAGLDQPRDLVGDHARLARTGARQHQARTMHVVDGFLLGGIQAGHRKGEAGTAGDDSGKS